MCLSAGKTIRILPNAYEVVAHSYLRYVVGEDIYPAVYEPHILFGVAILLV